MLEVQEPVMEPGPVVHRLKEPEPMVLKVVEGDRAALCHGSWGWCAILGVVAPMSEEVARLELEWADVGWPQKLGGEPPWGDGVICPLKHGAYLGEGGARPHHGDEGGLLLKSFSEPDKENIDELAVVDGVAEFTELVGKRLEPLTINPHLGVALDGVAELGVEGGDASIDVVLKELTKGRPQSSGVGGVTEDEIEDLGAHPLVDPLDDGEVVLHPARIRGLGDGVGADMAEEIAAA
jgi:hypothetical protein